MIFAEADLAPETRVLTVSVATLTLEVLSLDHLTAGLVLELVVLAEELEAEAAGEDTTAVFPDSSLTLDTLGVPEGTVAGVVLQALLAVANPGLAEVTDSTHHLVIKKVLTQHFSPPSFLSWDNSPASQWCSSPRA